MFGRAAAEAPATLAAGVLDGTPMTRQETELHAQGKTPLSPRSQAEARVSLPPMAKTLIWPAEDCREDRKLFAGEEMPTPPQRVTRKADAEVQRCPTSKCPMVTALLGSSTATISAAAPGSHEAAAAQAANRFHAAAAPPPQIRENASREPTPTMTALRKRQASASGGPGATAADTRAKLHKLGQKRPRMAADNGDGDADDDGHDDAGDWDEDGASDASICSDDDELSAGPNRRGRASTIKATAAASRRPAKRYKTPARAAAVGRFASDTATVPAAHRASVAQMVDPCPASAATSADPTAEAEATNPAMAMMHLHAPSQNCTGRGPTIIALPLPLSLAAGEPAPLHNGIRTMAKVKELGLTLAAAAAAAPFSTDASPHSNTDIESIVGREERTVAEYQNFILNRWLKQNLGSGSLTKLGIGDYATKTADSGAHSQTDPNNRQMHVVASSRPEGCAAIAAVSSGSSAYGLMRATALNNHADDEASPIDDYAYQRLADVDIVVAENHASNFSNYLRYGEGPRRGLEKERHCCRFFPRGCSRGTFHDLRQC